MNLGVLASILAASALGSLHCVAMCGPLAGMHGRSLRLAWMHSLGRLATYVVLGTLAGAVGGAIDLAGRLGNMQRVATIVAGLVVTRVGARTLPVSLVAATWVAVKVSDDELSLVKVSVFVHPPGWLSPSASRHGVTPTCVCAAMSMCTRPAP